jgi:hypothetical protein
MEGIEQVLTAIPEKRRPDHHAAEATILWDARILLFRILKAGSSELQRK